MYPKDTTLTGSPLQTWVTGKVVTPNDADYDSARHAWNLSVDQRPALILIAETVDDIAAGMRYAAANDLGVAVQSTGHGVILPPEGALLIVTSRLNGVAVDPATRTAWVQAGVKWAAVLEKAQEFGLAPLLGSSPTVGAVGYTLGGGMGWLARKYGMAVDSVIEFEVVTPAGEIVTASAEQNPELFWGLRGGGKGLVIVTGMLIHLYPVSEVFGGSLFYPLSVAKAALTFFREWTQTLPDEWTTSITVMHFPPMPQLPDAIRGQSFVMVNGCFVGSQADGEVALSAWTQWQAPVMNTFHQMPFTQVATISNDPVDPVPGVSSGMWLSDLSDDAIDKVLAYAAPAEGHPFFVKVDIRFAGGAIAANPRSGAAYSHRDRTYLLQTVGMAFTPDGKQMIIETNAKLKRALRDHKAGEYLNFLDGEEAHEKSPEGFHDDTRLRLARLKAQFDPNNLLRFGYKFGA